MSEQALVSIDEQVIDLETAPEARFDAEDALAKFEEASKFLDKARPASIKMTKPTDWVAMGRGDPKKTTVHLQGTGVDRFAGLWGLWFGKVTITREDYPDGTFAYICAGPAGCRRTGVTFENIEGSRWSGDAFFGRNPNPLSIRKASFENWKGRAGAMLTGMRGMTVSDVRKAGLDNVQTVEFQEGSQGGRTRTSRSRVKAKNAGEEGEWIGQLTDATSKTGIVGKGSRKGQPWKLFLYTSADGEEFGTFSDSDAAIADDCMADTIPVKIAWKVSDKGGKNITSIVPWQEEEPSDG